MKPRILAVIPTLGAPALRRAIDALLADPAIGALRVIAPATVPRIDAGASLEWIATPQPLGFAAAVNRGWAGGDATYFAVVNDDAEVAPGWGEALAGALDADPAAIGAQGVHFDADGTSIDGAGIAWNDDWQAVQLDHGIPRDATPPPAHGASAERSGPREVFGVSGTAALYRATALLGLVTRDGFAFDERLDSYYEDVDLALRLRRDPSAKALLVPAATARHQGSATGARRPFRRWTRIYANRRLVLRRLLGREYRSIERVVLRRDRRDLAAAILRADLPRIAALAATTRRERRFIAAFSHDGPPLVALATLRRFGAPAIATDDATPRAAQARG